ncbi:MAG: XRE family transcriptional regulator [Sphingomonadaceae bacterium]|nr:XRE family transcriptional regulator [Sphingomonadaceae bacterium]
MAEIVGGRLDLLRKKAGLSRNELARRTGVSQPTISRLISGETKSTSALMELARELETTPAYLTGETENSSSGVLSERRHAFRGAEPEHGPDIVNVAEIDLRFGLGGALMDQEIAESHAEMRPFPRDWLRHITTSAPDQLYWARGQGDSMEPKISEGDTILIDRSQTTPGFGDLYWAVAYGQTGMIKRLRPMPDGSVKILSDNPNVPLEIAYDGELHIFGRVVAVVKRI